MDSIAQLLSVFAHSDPAVLVASVAIVSLVVIYQVVRHITASKKD